MGLTVLLSVIIILANLVVDILYGILDPRTRDARTAPDGRRAARGADRRRERRRRRCTGARRRHGRRAGPRSRTSGATPGTATSGTAARVVAGVVFVLLVALLHHLADRLAVRPERDRLREQATRAPSLAHPFGTDQFGRDLLTRAALGGRVSIGIGFAATLAILIIGVTYGSISGFVGGRLDNAMMRFLDALYGLPYLPFAIITLAIFGNVELLDDGRSRSRSRAGSRRRASCAARSSR